MSDRNKPSIPAWQRAQPKPPAPQDDPVSSQPETTETTSSKDNTTESPPREPDPVPSDTTSPTTAPVASDLEKEAEAEAETPKAAPSSTLTSDFAQYQQQNQPRPTPQQPQQQSQPTAPPIITYPEFLANAHKPPPLITPTRIINTLYVAGGISALLYGASKWLVTPMVETLSESRHEFLGHSQTKIDELNERLSKIVSKLPPEPKSKTSGEEDDDVESLSSDPTELYHRDQGTQTSSPPPEKAIVKKSPVDHETAVLEILQSHIAELTESSEKAGEAHKDRQTTINKLRHYLDTLVYNMDGLPTWEAGIDGTMTAKKAGEVKQDAIEELKREVRGVKGVLLSAKRFPAARAGAVPA